MIHPWMAENQGVWYRVQTLENGSTKVTDIGLKDRDPVSYTLQIQEDGGPVRETRTEVLPVEIWGEENVQIEDRSWACEIRGTKKPGGGYDRTWVLSQSRHAGAILMQETPEGKVVAQRVWEHTLRVGSRTYDCLVVEARVEGSGRLTKTWYSPAYPLGIVRVESERGSVALVASGDGWTTRPPIR
jgi:hypothetical protein